MSELWLSYHQASRAHAPPTAQLLALDAKAPALLDLEDVLEHVLAEGFLAHALRPLAWWEKHGGERVRNSAALAELLAQGAGACQEAAMRLVIADVPPAMWISYRYTVSLGTPSITQRIKLDALRAHAGAARPRLAHVTNVLFERGFLAAHLRTRVRWQGVCGADLAEDADLFELLTTGEGICEEQPLRLVVDNAFLHDHRCHA